MGKGNYIMSLISQYDIRSWNPSVDNLVQQTLLEDVEKGQVIYLPQLPFSIAPADQHLLDPKYLAQGTKNISYNPANETIKGFKENMPDAKSLKMVMQDFSNKSNQLIRKLFPHYEGALRLGRTSFRPAEILGRKSSFRKDDTLLHVDAFPSMPMQGERILRLFSNINPNNKARHWHLGEPFNTVMDSFAPKIKQPIPGVHTIMNLLGITKKKRTPYDHYMLNIHHKMKKDSNYQQKAIQEKMDFPANTTWIVFTDIVSHAALSGQHLLEQTFYLPAEAQLHPEWAPLKQLEGYLQRPLL